MTNEQYNFLLAAILIISVVACLALGLSIGLLDKVTTIETAIIGE